MALACGHMAGAKSLGVAEMVGVVTHYSSRPEGDAMHMAESVMNASIKVRHPTDAMPLLPAIGSIG